MAAQAIRALRREITAAARLNPGVPYVSAAPAASFAPRWVGEHLSRLGQEQARRDRHAHRYDRLVNALLRRLTRDFNGRKRMGWMFPCRAILSWLIAIHCLFCQT